MTTCLGKSCSFGLPRVPFVNCYQFMYLLFPFWFWRQDVGSDCISFWSLLIFLLWTIIYSGPPKGDSPSHSGLACGGYIVKYIFLLKSVYFVWFKDVICLYLHCCLELLWVFWSICLILLQKLSEEVTQIYTLQMKNTIRQFHRKYGVGLA